MALRKRLHGFVRILCLLSVSLAHEENYLHTGCAVTLSLHGILENSLTIHVQYPPEKQFSLHVQQGEDTQVALTINPGATSETPKWTPMDLVFEGVPQLKFQNGTTWLSGEPDKELQEVIPKDLMIPEGFLPNCPQERPNWIVQENMASRSVILNRGEDEVFSLIAIQETSLSFSVDQTTVLLCWNAETHSMMALDRSESSACKGLPASTVAWLKITFRGTKVEMIDPSRHAKLFGPFHVGGMNVKLSFNGDGVKKPVRVVHHLKGYPKPQEATRNPYIQVAATSDVKVNEKSMCEVVSIVVGIFAILVILILCLLTTLFYNRWINARQILLLLKNSSHSGLDITEGGKPSLPSRPPPTLKGGAPEDNYLTPKELFGDEERPKSDHVYEDMVPHGWAPKLPAVEVSSRSNKAFESPENYYAAPKKTKPASESPENHYAVPRKVKMVSQ